jgi:hypothetical protein
MLSIYAKITFSYFVRIDWAVFILSLNEKCINPRTWNFLLKSSHDSLFNAHKSKILGLTEKEQ